MTLPRERSRADYRVIARILQLSHGQSEPTDKLLEVISRIYTKNGGSWVSFFEGNPTHCKLLKSVVKAVVKKKKDEYERRRTRNPRRED
jgi:hypothetical protein